MRSRVLELLAVVPGSLPPSPALGLPVATFLYLLCPQMPPMEHFGLSLCIHVSQLFCPGALTASSGQCMYLLPTHRFTFVCICIHPYMYVCSYVFVSTHLFIYPCIYLSVHMQTYICIHPIYTYLCICQPSVRQLLRMNLATQ